MEQLHKDLKTWHRINGGSSQLIIGTPVEISSQHPLKNEYNGRYYVLGLELDKSNNLDITIAKHPSRGLLSEDSLCSGWKVEDLLALPPSSICA